MKTNIGISEKHTDSVTSLLSILLADAMVLYVKTRKFHRNVTGENFMEQHGYAGILTKQQLVLSC